MKPQQVAAEKERRAKVKLRKMARSIPDNAVFINMLSQMDSVFRSEFYRRVKPHLKFQPVPLEVVNHG